MHWVYIVECSDGTYYTGYTTDVKRRLKEHNESPKGAKYTRARRPVTLCYQASYETREKSCDALHITHMGVRVNNVSKQVI